MPSRKPVTETREHIRNINAIIEVADTLAANAGQQRPSDADVRKAHKLVMRQVTRDDRKLTALPGGRRRTRRRRGRGGDMATLDPKTLLEAKKGLRDTRRDVTGDLARQPIGSLGTSHRLLEKRESLRITPPSSRSGSPVPPSPTGARRRTRRTRRT